MRRIWEGTQKRLMLDHGLFQDDQVVMYNVSLTVPAASHVGARISPQLPRLLLNKPPPSVVKIVNFKSPLNVTGPADISTIIPYLELQKLHAHSAHHCKQRVRLLPSKILKSILVWKHGTMFRRVARLTD
ncbi:hypothetical protein J6590_045061 [Homalodisca vitripennis]|nr:hypothetical protein J6590_045061 [Homalodisca vitripennis]